MICADFSFILCCNLDIHCYTVLYQLKFLEEVVANCFFPAYSVVEHVTTTCIKDRSSCHHIIFLHAEREMMKIPYKDG